MGNQGYLTGITSSMVTTAIGYTPLSNATTFWGRTVSSGVVSGNMSGVGSIEMSSILYMSNGQSIQFKDSNGTYRNILTLNSSNTLAIGYHTRQQGYTTDIQGGAITFATNGGSTATDNRVEVGEFTANGQFYIKRGTQGLRIGDGLITWDSANNALKIQRISNGSTVDGGLYATSFISALGANSSGGGGGGIGDVTWTALADNTDTRTIAFSHLSSVLANADVSVNSLTIGGECHIYDDGGDLALSATYGEIYMDDNCNINGTAYINNKLTVHSGGFEVTSGVSQLKGGADIYYAGTKRLYFDAPASGVYVYHIDAQSVACTGSVSATSFNTTSDQRKKDIIDRDAIFSVNDIANAPAIHFRWKSGADTNAHVGTLAQYWRDICPEAVAEGYDGYYGIQYDVLAMLNTISIAKTVTSHEQRIAVLEAENERLKKEIEQLKS